MKALTGIQIVHRSIFPNIEFDRLTSYTRSGFLFISQNGFSTKIHKISSKWNRFSGNWQSPKYKQCVFFYVIGRNVTGTPTQTQTHTNGICVLSFEMSKWIEEFSTNSEMWIHSAMNDSVEFLFKIHWLLFCACLNLIDTEWKRKCLNSRSKRVISQLFVSWMNRLWFLVLKKVRKGFVHSNESHGVHCACVTTRNVERKPTRWCDSVLVCQMSIRL